MALSGELMLISFASGGEFSTFGGGALILDGGGFLIGGDGLLIFGGGGFSVLDERRGVFGVCLLSE